VQIKCTAQSTLNSWAVFFTAEFVYEME